MATVTIGGQTYTIYGSQTANDPTSPPDPPAPTFSALNYLNGTAAGPTWAALSADAQARALVQATRFLDRQSWAGEKTSGAQALAWPRTGVTYADGTAVDSTYYPREVVYAAYELAYLVTQKPTILDDNTGTSKNVKRVKAGTAEVEFFTATDGVPMPQVAWDLVAQFMAALAGGSGTGLAIAYGTGAESAFDSDDDFYRIG